MQVKMDSGSEWILIDRKLSSPEIEIYDKAQSQKCQKLKIKDPQASKGVVKGEINDRHSAKETVKKKSYIFTFIFE